MPEVLNDTVVAEGHDRRVEIEWIGEGVCGDYDENDPQDEPLLRFTVLDQVEDNGEWLPVDDGSYCTNLSATLPREVIQAAADYILREVEGVPNIKKLCEGLSWIGEKEARAYMERKED